jgi:hypothetical protein
MEELLLLRDNWNGWGGLGGAELLGYFGFHFKIADGINGCSMGEYVIV